MKIGDIVKFKIEECYKSSNELYHKSYVGKITYIAADAYHCLVRCIKHDNTYFITHSSVISIESLEPTKQKSNFNPFKNLLNKIIEIFKKKPIEVIELKEVSKLADFNIKRRKNKRTMLDLSSRKIKLDYLPGMVEN